jgi:hypothetical protein
MPPNGGIIPAGGGPDTGGRGPKDGTLGGNADGCDTAGETKAWEPGATVGCTEECGGGIV